MNLYKNRLIRQSTRRRIVRRLKTISMAGALLLIFGAAAAPAAEPAVSDERLKAIVKEVIRDNPKLIMETLNQYQQEQKRKQRERQFEAGFENRIADTAFVHNPRKGPEEAPVTIIEYTDFQCPYCARGARTIEQVLEMYPGKVRVVFKNLPLKMHKQAEPAARAALAAHRQGKFWDYHDLLFKNGAKLNDDLFIDFAGRLGMDVDRFKVDYASAEIAAQVEADMGQARRLRMNGTPRFLVNGVQIKGAAAPDYFAKVIDRLLAETGGRNS
jgi:protein-disulfide isomerase